MTKVALIAVAKDEDTYIHEWIHHHLYLGFSPIYIGVNRTSDKTFDIINKISQTEKQVEAFCIDWIDQGSIGKNKRIQNLAYAYLNTKIDKELVDYVGFLDIDEFWFNVDRKNIQNFIEERKPFDIASFFWLCQYGEDSEFSPPFKNVHYQINNYVKTIIHTSLLDKVETFTVHVPSFLAKNYKGLIHIDQNGNDISRLAPEKICNSVLPIIDKKISSCILHRMMRSEREYLSLIFRGHLNGDFINSNNRRGYRKAYIPLPVIFDESYYTSLIQFINTHNLADILNVRRTEKLVFYKDKIKNMHANQLIAEVTNAIYALNNTIGLKFFVNEFIKKVTDVESLKIFATKLEEIDINLSIQTMKKAHELRPTGPFIKQKLDEYEGIVNSTIGTPYNPNTIVKKSILSEINKANPLP